MEQGPHAVELQLPLAVGKDGDALVIDAAEEELKSGGVAGHLGDYAASSASGH
jgi:hypothetical protein